MIWWLFYSSSAWVSSKNLKFHVMKCCTKSICVGQTSLLEKLKEEIIIYVLVDKLLQFVTVPYLGRNARIKASHEHLCPSVCWGIMIWSSFVHLCNSGKLLQHRNQCEKVQREILWKRRRYLFTESLSKLILCTHTHSAAELILWYSETCIFLITNSQSPRGLARIPWAWHKGMGCCCHALSTSSWLGTAKWFLDRSVIFLRRHQPVSFTSESCLLCSPQMKAGCCPLPVFPCFQHVCFPDRITGKAGHVWHCSLGTILLGSGSWVFCWHVICVMTVFKVQVFGLDINRAIPQLFC